MLIEAVAPVRICDNGGWTDTWFGAPGQVVNVAVTPGVTVTIRGLESGPGPVVVRTGHDQQRYELTPGQARRAHNPLIEAAVDAYPPPEGIPVEISVSSPVPPGSGTGTSAALGVALLGALFALRGEQASRAEIAHAAHRVEVDLLHTESGIQDQMSAAFGGINHLEIDPYPEVRVRALPAWPELGPRLTLLFLGQAHDSSSLHLEVIGNTARPRDVFDRLRAAARASVDAVLAGDLTAFGGAMRSNTDAQADLHHSLVGADARRVIELATTHGTLGWKVNGAGGVGGSMTLLSATPEAKAGLDRALAALDPRYVVVPVDVCPDGLRVRHQSSSRGSSSLER